MIINKGDFENVIIYNENTLENILEIIEKHNDSKIIVLDSLQVLETEEIDGEK
jgi:predicted ATP-dependent serine protease